MIAPTTARTTAVVRTPSRATKPAFFVPPRANQPTRAASSSAPKIVNRMYPVRRCPDRRCAAPGRTADSAVQPMSAPTVSGLANCGPFPGGAGGPGGPGGDPAGPPVCPDAWAGPAPWPGPVTWPGRVPAPACEGEAVRPSGAPWAGRVSCPLCAGCPLGTPCGGRVSCPLIPCPLCAPGRGRASCPLAAPRAPGRGCGGSAPRPPGTPWTRSGAARIPLRASPAGASWAGGVPGGPGGIRASAGPCAPPRPAAGPPLRRRGRRFPLSPARSPESCPRRIVTPLPTTFCPGLPGKTAKVPRLNGICQDSSPHTWT